MHMKTLRQVRLLHCALLLLLSALPLSAGSITLDWFRNPEPDIAGYKVYYGTVSGQYTTSANAGTSTNITISGLTGGQTYFFAATAYNTAGRESKPSTEISSLIADSTGPQSNSPPSITAPANFSAAKNTATPISGISLFDADAGSANVTVTIAATRGTISLRTNVAGGLTGAQVAFNRTASVQISAPIAAINATFANSNGLVYTGLLNLVGPDVLTFNVNDNGNSGLGGPLTASSQVTANVTGDSVDTWRNAYFNTADLIDPAKSNIWGDDADPDQDGFSDLQEYGLARDPLVRESGTNGLFGSQETISGQLYNTLTFNMRKNETAVQYIVEVSADNTTWLSGPANVILLRANDLSATLQSVTYRDAVPATQTRAIRLRITR